MAIVEACESIGMEQAGLASCLFIMHKNSFALGAEVAGEYSEAVWSPIQCRLLFENYTNQTHTTYLQWSAKRKMKEKEL